MAYPGFQNKEARRHFQAKICCRGKDSSHRPHAYPLLPPLPKKLLNGFTLIPRAVPIKIGGPAPPMTMPVMVTDYFGTIRSYKACSDLEIGVLKHWVCLLSVEGISVLVA